MKYIDKLAPHVHWLIRASIAATFIYHGIPKFSPDAGGLINMGLPLAVGWAVAVAEVVGGIAIFAGAFTNEMVTRFGGLCVVVIMIGAYFLTNLGNGWSSMHDGAEYTALLFACGLLFLTKGNKI